MNRRIFLSVGLGLMASTALPFAAIAQTPVTWWYESANPEQQRAITQGIIDPFNASQSDYQLTIDYRGSELDKQMRVALLSGNGPDIVYSAGPSYVAPMARAGQLMPLDDYAKQFGWQDRILPVFLEMGKYEGKLYALPKTYETLGLFYNKTLFKEHGWEVPTTIAELEAVSDAMLAENIVPFASGNANWRPANEHYVSLVLNSIAGPDNVYKALKGEMPWTAEPFVKAITKLNDWWQKGYFGPNYFSLSDEQAFAQMASGQAGMMPTGTWQFQRINTYFPQNNAEAGFVGFPSADDIGDPVYALGVGSTFSIAADANNPDGAAAAINYIFSDDAYAKMNELWQGEWNMPIADLASIEVKNVQPLYTDTMKGLATSVANNHYGYTTWTFLPPATDAFLVNGI
ncbi:ABC transporter substrate-binding protein [Consotaella salsifontis]|uniref:Carbohydrate ABC transporter substrate-binding protein, CUT1 family n=1 Tax=Consotaella salsifontis TaxID=1365950 RepID=A0A1T4LXR2_9HYPH|nr:extracellular solute-binding protein [Consotaella salsifontis]SJZ59533.1 carbohydrate ABC transporter substrate-binding protein, CUT1 family [Consotaella salsifontis]